MDEGKRRPGGQPGNKNALKHGFYSAHYTEDEAGRLEDLDAYSLDAEIEILRVYIDRIAKLVPATSEVALTEDQLKALNTLSTMTERIGGLVRVHYLVRGKGGEIDAAILEALTALSPEMKL